MGRGQFSPRGAIRAASGAANLPVARWWSTKPREPPTSTWAPAQAGRGACERPYKNHWVGNRPIASTTTAHSAIVKVRPAERLGVNSPVASLKYIAVTSFR